MNSVKKWAIYTRVSTSEQAESGASLEAQQEKCLMRIKLDDNYLVGPVFTDAGKSGKDLKRPAIQDLLERVAQGEFAGVVVWKLDRLTRSMKDLWELVELFRQTETELISIQEKIDTSGSMGRFVLSLMGAIAQLEREQTGERVKAVIAYKKSRGEFCGGSIPKGLKSEGPKGGRYLSVDPIEGPKVKPIWKMVSSGATLADVGEYLVSEGVRPNRSKKWQKATVSKLIKNKTYIGLLVSEAEFAQAEAVLEQRYSPTFGSMGKKRVGTKSKTKRVWLLQGIAKCGHCGGALVGSHHGRNNLPYLCCSTKMKKAIDLNGERICTAKNIPAKTYEQAVLGQLIKSLSGSPEVRDALALALAERQAQLAPSVEECKRATLERDNLKEQVSRLTELVAHGGAAARAVVDRLADLQMRVEALETKIEEYNYLIDAMVGSEGAIALQMQVLVSAANKLKDADPFSQQTVIRGLISEVRIWRDDRIEVDLAIPSISQPKKELAYPGVGRLVSNGDPEET